MFMSTFMSLSSNCQAVGRTRTKRKMQGGGERKGGQRGGRVDKA